MILCAAAAHSQEKSSPFAPRLALVSHLHARRARCYLRHMADQAISDYLSRLGRRGAQVRNAQLTAAERKKAARKAARARWKKARKPKKTQAEPRV